MAPKTSVGLRLFGHGALYTLGIFVMRTGNFVLLPVYTALLTTAEYGTVGLLKQLAQLLVLLALSGQGLAMLRLGIRKKASGEELATLAGTLTTYVAGAGVVLAMAAALAWPLFEKHLGGIPLWPLGFLALAWIPTTAFFQLTLSNLQQRELPHKHTALNLSRWLMLLVGVGIFVVGLRWGALGLLLATCLSFAGGALLGRTRLPPGSQLRIDPAVLKKGLAYGLPVVPHAMAGALLASADRVILASGPGLADVGRYTLAFNLASIVAMVATGLQRAWTPFFLRQDEDSSDEGWIHVRRLSFFSLAAVGGTVLVVGLGARILIDLAATPDYLSAVPVVAVLALGAFVNAYYGVAAAVIFSEQKAVRWIALVTVPPALVNIGLNLLWVPTLGMMGAAWATLTSSLLMFTGAAILSRKTRKVPFKFARGGVLFLVVAGLLYLGVSASWTVRAGIVVGYCAALLIIDWRDLLGAGRSVIRQLLSRRGRSDG